MRALQFLHIVEQDNFTFLCQFRPRASLEAPLGQVASFYWQLLASRCGFATLSLSNPPSLTHGNILFTTFTDNERSIEVYTRLFSMQQLSSPK